MKHITEKEIDYLWYSRCDAKSFPDLQFFEFIEDDHIPHDQGTLSWCRVAADALVLVNHYRENGIQAYVLHDIGKTEDLIDGLERNKDNPIVRALRGYWAYDEGFVVHSSNEHSGADELVYPLPRD